MDVNALAREAHDKYIEWLEHGDQDDIAEQIGRGRAGTISHREGRAAFGQVRRVQACTQLALVSEELVEKMVAARAKHLQEVEAAIDVRDSRKRKFCETVAGLSHGGALRHSAEASAGAVVRAARNLAFDWLYWAPPGTTIAHRTLSDPRRSPVKKLRASLSNAWADRHKILKARDLPPMQTPAAPRVRVCFFAGFCLCGAAMRPVARLAHRVAMAFSAALKPNTAQRQLYDRSALVVSLSAGDDVRWWQLSYGNLNTHRFELLRLVAVPGCQSLRAAGAVALGLKPLRVPDGCLSDSCSNLWEAFRPLDCTRTWHLSYWQLYRENIAVPDELTPALVAVRRVYPSADRDVDGAPPARAPRPRVQLAAIADDHAPPLRRP